MIEVIAFIGFIVSLVLVPIVIVILKDLSRLEDSETRRLSRLSKGDDKFKILTETNTNLVLKVRELERLCQDSSDIANRIIDIIEKTAENVQNNTNDLDKLLKPKKSKKKVSKKVVKKKITKKKGVKK